MGRFADYLAEKLFGLIFRLLWKFIKLIFIGPLAPFILGRELWKVWYPRSISTSGGTEEQITDQTSVLLKEKDNDHG